MALSDRVAVTDNGVIVECGTPEDLYLRPRTAFAARFVGQADLLPATLAAREDGRWWLATPLGRIESRCAPDAPAASLHLLIRPEHIGFAYGGGGRPACTQRSSPGTTGPGARSWWPLTRPISNSPSGTPCTGSGVVTFAPSSSTAPAAS